MASFNEESLRKKLDGLNMSQQSIQTLSLWLVHHKKHAHVVVNAWYRELLKVPDSRKLSFMYLANDVIQVSKKKGPEYNKEFSQRLPKVFKHLGTINLDEKSRKGINRLLEVWEERAIFEPSVLKELKKRAGVPQNSTKSERDGSHKAKKRKFADIEHEFPTAYESSAPKDVTPIIVDPPESSPIEPKSPPEPESLIQALQNLENAAAADAEVRKKIADLPSALSDLNILNQLTDAVAGRTLIAQAEDALAMLEVYNERLSQEMEARKDVAKLLHDYISHQKDCLSVAEETLEEHKKKLVKVQKVKEEVKAHIQNLPDISKLPDVTGQLAPLPSAGDLFT